MSWYAICDLQIVKIPPKLIARTREGSGATLKKSDLFHGTGCTYLLCSCILTMQLLQRVALERYFCKIRHQILHSKTELSELSVLHLGFLGNCINLFLFLSIVAKK